MKKYLLLTLIPVLAVLFIPASADNPFLDLFNQVFNQLTNHELRITELEEKTSVTIVATGTPLTVTNFVTGETQSIITENCEIIDYTEEMIRGWCPDASHRLYLIEDIRTLPTSLVLTNIQDRTTEAPSSKIIDSGFITINNVTYQGFIIKVSDLDTQPTNKLIYSIFG